MHRNFNIHQIAKHYNTPKLKREPKKYTKNVEPNQYHGERNVFTARNTSAAQPPPHAKLSQKTQDKTKIHIGPHTFLFQQPAHLRTTRQPPHRNDPANPLTP
jgi:hypothetical protein